MKNTIKLIFSKEVKATRKCRKWLKIVEKEINELCPESFINEMELAAMIGDTEKQIELQKKLMELREKNG